MNRLAAWQSSSVLDSMSSEVAELPAPIAKAEDHPVLDANVKATPTSTAEEDQKRTALLKINQGIERWAQLDNPVVRYTKDSTIVISDVHVERVRAERTCSKQSGTKLCLSTYIHTYIVVVSTFIYCY